jgi:hypothetical protein
MDEEESKRVSLQVTSLSTRLIESIEKQGQLEGQIVQLEKENTQLKDSNESLSKKLQVQTKLRKSAEEEVSNLQKEVEELSASLFDEANKMVSDARREKHEIQVRNDGLISQLREKDSLLDNLQTQLKVLKDVLHERDRDLDLAPKISNVDSSSPNLQQPTKHVLYSPTVNAIRYDLKLFGEFKKFTKAIQEVDSIKDTETKFIKKLLTDEVEPALRLDNAHGISWLNRRSLMSYFIDGRVSIEPVSGINETYRINFQNNKINETDVKSSLYSYPPQSPPVAIDQSCAICGESRDDILEHSRLYVLKVHGRSESSISLTPAASPGIYTQYPLCSYCLFRVRSACDLFAFLRSLKTDVWKLENDAIMKKAWIELSRLRSKLFWSKVGIWDLDSNIVTTRITPRMDDAVYSTVSKNSDNSRFSVYSSTESLTESKPVLDGANNKPSPLVKEMPRSPGNPATFVQGIEKENDSYFPDQGKIEEPYDDILDTYSEEGEQSEGEPSEEDTITTRTKGLEIKVDNEVRPQDALVFSESSTPVVERHSSFKAPTTQNGEVETHEQKTEETPAYKDSSEDDKFVDA